MIPAPNGHGHRYGLGKFCAYCGVPAGSPCTVSAPRGQGFCGECGEPVSYVEDRSQGFTSGQWQHDSDHSPAYRCPAFRGLYLAADVQRQKESGGGAQ